MKHLFAAIVLACFAENAAAHETLRFLGEEGVRVWHGVNIKDAGPDTADSPAKSSQEKQQAEPAKTEAAVEPVVKIPEQPPIYKTGYRIRCRTRGASSCALSDVVVDVFDQPAIRRARGLPSTTVYIGTETRDGVEYAVAQVIRRGVPVHQAGIPDNWRIRTHSAGVSTTRNIPVKKSGVSNERNIRVKRAGTSNKRNIRVKRAGVSNNQNIRVR